MTPEDLERLRAEEAARRSAAAKNVSMQGRSPADVARAKTLAQQFGVAVPLVESEPEVFERQLQQQKTEEAIAQHPWMTPLLAANPDTAAMVGKDDLPKMGDIVSAFGMTPSGRNYTLAKPDTRPADLSTTPLPKALPSYGKRVGITTKAVVGTAINNIVGATAGIAESVTDLTGLDDTLDPYFRQIEQGIRAENQGLQEEMSGWVTTGTKRGAFSAAVSMTQLAAGLPAGAAKVLPLLTGITYGNAYSKYQGRDANVGMSILGAGLEGGIEYATERLGLKYVLGPNPLKNGAKRFLFDYTLRDTLGEQLATVGQSAVDQLIAPEDPNRSFKDWLTDPARGQEAWETLVASTVMSASIGGGRIAMERLGKASDNAVDATDALIGQSILDDVMTKAEKVELRTTSPEEFANFVNEGAKHSPVKNVYIPIEAIETALADETLGEEEKAVLSLYQSQIDEARVNSGEVIIPIGDAAARLAGTKLWQALKDDARVLPGGISAREAREQMETMVEELESIGNQAVADAQAAGVNAEGKAAVFNAVKAQVLAAGRSEKEAQTTAVLMASRAEALASPRYGKFKNAAEAWEWMQLQIVGADAKPAKGKATKLKQAPFTDVTKLLDRDDWALMTAENPDAQQLSPEENAARLAELKTTLDAMGLTYTEVRGKYDNEENSLAVEGITEAQARALGARFGQDSVLTRRGLIYRDGTVNPARGVGILGRDAENYFTELPDGTKFAIDIDFDTRLPIVPGPHDVLYHGTPREFDTFRDNGKAIWLTTSPSQAGSYANARRQRLSSGDRIIPVNVNITNPLFVDPAVPEGGQIADPVAWAKDNFGFDLREHGWERNGEESVFTVTRSQAFADAAKAAGFDAIGITEGGNTTWGILGAGTITSSITPSLTLNQDALPENEQAASLGGALELARSRQFADLRDFKMALQKAVKQNKGNLRSRKRLFRLAFNDVTQALRNNTNAVGWYDDKVTHALSVFAAIHPEIEHDENAKFAFIYALAVTSNGLKVNANFKLADKVYRQYKANGQMPVVGEGTASLVMEASLSQFNVLTDKLGIEGLRELMLRQDITVGELEKLVGIPVGGEYKGTKVTGAAFLGPKIGNGFFSNLYGNFDQLTMDRWFIRTWGRWTGTLITEDKAKIKAGREKVSALLRSLTPAQRKEVGKILSTKGSPFTVKLTDIDGFARRVLVRTAHKQVRDQLAAVHPRLRLDPKRLAVQLDGQKEAPDGPKERNEIRSIMVPVLQQLKRDNPDLTMADLQALLWYPEKTLYDTAKAKPGVDVAEGYENDEAPDYANAAVALARSEGVSEEKIREAIAKADRRVAATKRTGRTERAAGEAGPSFTLTEDARGFPAEDVLTSEGDGTLDALTLQQFGGVRVGAYYGGTALRSRQREAEDMEAAGADSAKIWKRTGWHRDADGLWRFEISDQHAKLRMRPSGDTIRAEDAVSGIDYTYHEPAMLLSETEMVVGARLGYLMDHPDLFKHYPGLEDMPVYFFPQPGGQYGAFYGDRLVIDSSISDEEALSTLLHEIQHAIQSIEGFTNGANTNEDDLKHYGLWSEYEATISHFEAINAGEVPGWNFKSKLTPEQIKAAAAYDVYHRTLGEVEARNVQKRMKYTDAQRRRIPPGNSADVPMDRRIVPEVPMAMAAASRPAASLGQGPRGEATFYPNGRTIVQLFSKADFSTMLHEMSHVFLQQEFTLAKEEGASAELKADIETLTKWFTAHGGALDKNGMPDVAAHELFARTGERYFREGKAPSAELRSAFKQFKTWLTGVYESVKDLLAYGAAPINPEIREIMDRIITTSEAIEANAIAPLSQEELGMSDTEYAAYLDSVGAARDDAFDTLLERMMKAITRREQGKLREQRATVRAEVADEVNADPRFIALHLLRTGRWLGDPAREATPIKLNTGWLIDNYGEEVLKQLPVGLQPLHRGDGVVGDAVAELVGMPSGDALVQALRELKAQADQLKADGNPRPLRDQLIEDKTDAIMAERHGDIAMSREEIEEEAIAALNAQRQGEVLAAELRQLRKKNAKPGAITPYQLLREWARRKVNEGTVDEAVSKTALQRYIRAFNKARTAFENALLKKDANEAIKQKQAQMINHALLAEGKVVADEINAIVRRMQRYARTKAMASIDQDYMDRIHELLEGYNFRNVSDASRAQKASFEAWAETQRALGHEVHVPPRFRDERTNWKDAKVTKLLELNDMVQSLAAQGKLKQRLTTARAERELAATIDDAESRILQLPPRTLPDSSTGGETKPFMQAAREDGYRKAIANLFRPGARTRQAAAGLVKIEGLMDVLDGTKDGTGPLNQFVVQPATDAANLFSQLMEEVMEPIIARYKQMSRKQSARLRDFVTIPELTLNVSIHEADTDKLGQPLTIPRMKLIGLLLNTGNLSNLSKLVGGERWGDPESATDLARVRDILVSHASKEDLDLVQDIWNGVSKLWPHIARVERELSGIVPEEVVPVEFETPYGPYSGGYWPVVWDSTRSEMGKRQGEEAETSLQGVGFGIATPKGHTITRTGAMAPMEWSVEHVLFGHMTKVISRIAYAPWVRDTLKIVDNARVTGAIRLRLGNEYVSAIKPWIRDQIPSNMPDVQGAKSWEKFLDHVRVNMSIAVLGISFTTGVAQSLGLSYSAGVLGDGSVKAGGKWIAKGFMEMIKLQKSGAAGAQEFVFARSDEMKRRAHEVNQEASEVFRRLRDNDSLYRRMQAAAFWHIGFIDINMVAIPTWLGGYHKALGEGLSEEEAIHYAEKMVRLSQSSGRKKDLSAIQRGNAGQKFISMFYTPSSVFFNQQWEAAQHLKAGNWSKALAPTFWFLVATTIADAMREGDWPEDDDEDGIGGVDVAEWVGRNLLFGAFYGIPVARDVTNAAERKLRGEYAEYGSTPLTALATTVERGVKSTGKLIEGEEAEGKDLKNAVSAMGFLLGLPGNQVGKTSGFVKDVYDGKVQPDSAYDWYHGLAYGKPPAEQE